MRIPGFLSPLFLAVIGVSFTVIVLLIIKWITNRADLPLLKDVMDYCIKSLFMIFLIGLLVEYAAYLSRFKRTLGIASPMLWSIAAILTLVFTLGVLGAVNTYLEAGIITIIGEILFRHIFLLFALFLFFGYLRYIIDAGKALFRQL